MWINYSSENNTSGPCKESRINRLYPENTLNIHGESKLESFRRGAQSILSQLIVEAFT